MLCFSLSWICASPTSSYNFTIRASQITNDLKTLYMFSNSWNECPAFHWIDQPTNNAPCSGYGITTSVTVTVMLPVPCFCVLPVKPCDGFWIWNGAPLYKLYLFRSICRDRGSFWALGVFGRFSMFWVVLVPSGYGYGLPSRRCRNWRWSGLDVGICPFSIFWLWIGLRYLLRPVTL